MQCSRSFLKYGTQLKVFWGSQDQCNHNFWEHLEISIFGVFWTPLFLVVASNYPRFCSTSTSRFQLLGGSVKSSQHHLPGLYPNTWASAQNPFSGRFEIHLQEREFKNLTSSCMLYRAKSALSNVSYLAFCLASSYNVPAELKSDPGNHPVGFGLMPINTVTYYTKNSVQSQSQMFYFISLSPKEW